MAEIDPSTDKLKLYLRREFSERCRKNPLYSLRSFAKQLNLNHSALSKILRGKRPLTAKTAVKIVQTLKLDPETQKAVLPFGAFSMNSSTAINDFEQISLPAIEVMNDWHHIAVAEFLSLPNFNFDVSKVAKAMDCDKTFIEQLINNLIRVGLVEFKEGRFQRVTPQFKTTVQLPGTNRSLVNFQKKMLNKACDALEELPLEKRDHTGLTFVMDPQRMNEAKQVIKEFRRKMSDLFEKGKNRRQVYHLSLALFPLSKEING